MTGADPATLLARLPVGWSEVLYRGQRWGVTRSVLLGGRVEKLYAEELGGTGVVSANFYRGACDALRPCEMPERVVLDLLREWQAT